MEDEELTLADAQEIVATRLVSDPAYARAQDVLNAEARRQLDALTQRGDATAQYAATPFQGPEWARRYLAGDL